MKKIFALGLLLVLALPALAVEEGQVMYVGGTAEGVNASTLGRLNTTNGTALIFEYSGNKLAIPYDSIQSFQYSKELTHHLGVLPTIAVGALKMQKHRHFFRISYRDSNHVAQAAVFEVPKHMPRTLQAVLETRAPETCKPALTRAGRN